MTTVNGNCFDSQNLINEFDEFQADYPEEIWRLDIERKYIRTFTGKSVDESVTTGKQNTRFLTSMMQGRKKYQRRQWIRDQGVYFQSKYKLPSIMNSHNEYSVTLGADPESLDVPVDYTLKLTPYQDMYLNVVLGNGTPIEPKRAKAGVEYPITIPTSGSVQETRITIAGGDYLSSISNLAPMYPYSLDFSHINHLKKFDMGTDEVGYVNTKLAEQGITSLGDGGGPLLEEVNVKNCHSLTELKSLNKSNNLKIVEATGTAITGIDLPDYTNIEILHLPSTIASFSLSNAVKLKDFYMKNNLGQEDYNNLYELNVLNSDYSGTYLWKPSTKYQVGDIFIVDNNLCQCKKEHTSITDENAAIEETWNTYKTTNWVILREDANPSVNWIGIALGVLEKNSAEVSISLKELYSATIKNIQVLVPLQEIKSDIENHNGVLDLTGIIHITGSWSLTEGKVYTNDIGYYNDGEWVNALTADDESPNDNPLWPHLKLIVNPEQKQIKWPVTYHYDNKTMTIYIPNNTVAPDIYENGTIDMPTKASVPKYRYVFGEYNDQSGKYISYSGWSYSNTSNAVHLSGAPQITSATHLHAWFKGIERQYYVRWYVKPNQLVKTSGATKYGEGYNLENPTIKDIHDKHFSTCEVNVGNDGLITYSIFTGWDKLPTNIEPSGDTNYYDIYGVWDNNNGHSISIGDLFTDGSKKTVQLLVLSVLTEEQKATYHLDDIYDDASTITYQLGQDNNRNTGHQIIPIANSTAPLSLDGSNAFTTSYQPLLAGSDAFTFAIDYTFDEGNYATNKFAILASCYYSADNVRNGFCIYKNTSSGNIEIGFGDMFRLGTQKKVISTNNTANMRNIVVIRHPKESSTLYIYSGLSDTQTVALETPAYLYITRNGETEFNSPAYLNIGQLVSDIRTIPTSDDIRNKQVNAIGTIHWAKFWSEDLGIGECKRLASWPHEQLTFAIAHCYREAPYDFYSPAPRADDNYLPDPALYLTTCNSLMHGLVIEDKIGYSGFINDKYHWEYAKTRKLCNNRLLYSLPTSLQAILCKSAVSSIPIEYYTLENESGYRKANYTEITRDYLYAPSVSNIDGNNEYIDEDPIDNGAMIPFPWKIPENTKVYRQDENQNWTLSTGQSQYVNIRFPYKAFNLTNQRIYVSDVSLSVNIAEYIGADTLQSGDIYIERGKAYIYVSNREINTYGLNAYVDRSSTILTGLPDSEVTNIGGGQGRGGWIPAESYWTRSLISTGSTSVIFAEVNEDGSTNVSQISASSIGYRVNYIMAI